MDKSKIFIVDDSLAARILLRRIIESSENFEVVGEADSALAALIMFDEVNPNIVMLEAGVAGTMSVADIIKELKNLDPFVKIVMVLDVISAKNPSIAYNLGFDDVIMKPYKHDKILEVLNNVRSIV